MPCWQSRSAEEEIQFVDFANTENDFFPVKYVRRCVMIDAVTKTRGGSRYARRAGDAGKVCKQSGVERVDDETGIHVEHCLHIEGILTCIV